MAHEDTYGSDSNQAKTVSDWQASYPATRYMYGTVTKRRTLHCYQSSSGDYWTQVYEWHWSYWVVLDWVYPNDTGWTNAQKPLLNNTWHRSIGNGSVEGDADQPVREKILTYGGGSNTTEVDITIPSAENNGNHYDFFQTYQMTESECHAVSEYAYEGTQEYFWSAGITNDRGDLWELNNSGKLILEGIHEEVLPDEENPSATQWYLNESGQLRMRCMRELKNDLGAFNNNPNLTSVIFPESIESIGKLAFNNTGLTEVTLPEFCIYYPSSFPSNCIVHGGTLYPRYSYTTNEIASGTELTTTISCSIGDLVVATIAIRGTEYSISEGWTLLGISEAESSANQRTLMVYKIAESVTESITVTQDTNGRIYTNLISLVDFNVGTFSGFTNVPAVNGITVNRPEGIVLWGISCNNYSTATPYAPWTCDRDGVVLIQQPNTTQPRCLTVLDFSGADDITFTRGGSASADSNTIEYTSLVLLKRQP